MKSITEGHRELGELFHQRQFRAPIGTTIFESGRPGNRLFVLNQGEVIVGDNNGPVTTRGPGGKALGKEVLSRKMYQATAIAQEDSRLGSATREQVHQLLKISPEIGLVLPEFLAGREVTEEDSATLIEIPRPSQLRVLQLVASGLDHPSIGEELNIGVYTVRSHIINLNEKLKTHASSQAAFTGYELGLVNGEAAVEGLAFSQIGALTSLELQLLQAFTANGGELSTTKKLAQYLGISEGRVDDLFPSIRDHLFTKNRIQSGIFYLVAQDRGLLEGIQH